MTTRHVMHRHERRGDVGIVMRRRSERGALRRACMSDALRGRDTEVHCAMFADPRGLPASPTQLSPIGHHRIGKRDTIEPGTDWTTSLDERPRRTGGRQREPLRCTAGRSIDLPFTDPIALWIGEEEHHADMGP
jgi:hypothetical protein